MKISGSAEEVSYSELAAAVRTLKVAGGQAALSGGPVTIAGLVLTATECELLARHAEAVGPAEVSEDRLREVLLTLVGHVVEQAAAEVAGLGQGD